MEDMLVDVAHKLFPHSADHYVLPESQSFLSANLGSQT